MKSVTVLMLSGCVWGLAHLVAFWGKKKNVYIYIYIYIYISSCREADAEAPAAGLDPREPLPGAGDGQDQGNY